jgi:Gamma-glutamyl cyclotransferase, AIG2-like
VTFVNLVPVEGDSVAGVVFPVDREELAALDRRERNYERHDVTDRIEQTVDGRIWTYIGTHAAEERHAEGLRLGRAVVSRAYLEGIRDAFRNVGEAALGEFEASTDPPGCPTMDLERVDLP